MAPAYTEGMLELSQPQRCKKQRSPARDGGRKGALSFTIALNCISSPLSFGLTRLGRGDTQEGNIHGRKNAVSTRGGRPPLPALRDGNISKLGVGAPLTRKWRQMNLIIL